MEKHDVVIVGAGAAGVGIACMLKDLGLELSLIHISEPTRPY